MSFDISISFVLKAEGGFVEDFRDSGGVTNHGISIRFLNNLVKSSEGLELLRKIGIEPPLLVGHVRDLTEEQAKYIYRKEFWDKVQGDIFLFPLNLVLFDAGVNCGVAQSVKFCQRAYNGLSTVYGGKLVEDGILGLRTRRAFLELNNMKFIEACIVERELYYEKLVELKPGMGVFLNGWNVRCGNLRKYVKLMLKKMEKKGR